MHLLAGPAPNLEDVLSRLLRALLPAAVLVVAPLLSAVPASAEGPDASGATLTVVHGVRGLVADVRVDDRLVLVGFTPLQVTDPLPLTAGPHHLQAWQSGVGQGAAPLIDETVTLAPGQRATAGIGIGAQGKPVVTLFDDGPLLPAADSTALAVRGLATADPVQVVAGQRTIATALTAAQQQVQQVDPATYTVSTLPQGGGDPVVAPQDVPLVAGRAVVLYFVGSQADRTLGWIAQTVLPSTAAAAPARVDTGVGPVPAAGTAGTTALVLGLPVGLLAAIGLRRQRDERRLAVSCAPAA